jgi:hypothetical protein
MADAALPLDRHPELVSGPIAPLCPERAGEHPTLRLGRVQSRCSQEMPRMGPETSQGDEIGVWVRVTGPGRKDWQTRRQGAEGPRCRLARARGFRDPAALHRRRPSARPRPAGFAPFTRGPYASMYTGRPWTIRQYAGVLDRRGIERVLSPQPRRGAEGAVGGVRSRDAPGYDSDHPRVHGDVGKAGRGDRHRAATWRSCSTGFRSARCRSR